MKTIFLSTILVLISVLSMSATSTSTQTKTDDVIGDIVIINGNTSGFGDDRSIILPFYLTFDETNQTIIFDYTINMPITINITSGNGHVISSYEISNCGQYLIDIPSNSGIYYLLLTSQNICAYTLITIE